jgi:hypothetical protein
MWVRKFHNSSLIDDLENLSIYIEYIIVKLRYIVVQYLYDDDDSSVHTAEFFKFNTIFIVLFFFIHVNAYAIFLMPRFNI